MNPAQTAIAGVIGSLATTAIVVLGSVVALVFAATMALVVVLTAALMAMAAVAFRLNRLQPQPVPVITARKVGHSWVAWDDRR